jgi:hypothetical protein
VRIKTATAMVSRIRWISVSASRPETNYALTDSSADELPKLSSTDPTKDYRSTIPITK